MSKISSHSNSVAFLCHCTLCSIGFFGQKIKIKLKREKERERERREWKREKRRTLSQSQKLVAQSTFAAKQYSFKMTFNIALIFQLWFNLWKKSKKSKMSNKYLSGKRSGSARLWTRLRSVMLRRKGLVEIVPQHPKFERIGNTF